MPDILIRHCTLHIVRRGGWSWGPDPAKLVQNAVGIIAELLERKLPEFWSDDEDFEIAAPVRIRVPVRLHELLGVPSEYLDYSSSPTSALDERFERAIEVAFAPFVASFVSPSAPSEPDEDLRESYAATEQTRLGSDHIPGGSIQRVLLSWHERGLLEAYLAAFSLQALEVWHRRLLEASGASLPGVVSSSPEEFIEQIRGIMNDLKENPLVIRGELTDRPPDRAAQLRYRLQAAVEVAARLGIAPHHPAVLKALDRTFPLADQDIEESGETVALVPTTAQQVTAASTRLWQGEFSVSSALPFLLLGPLSRIGYLEALSACLEAAEMLSSAPQFAQALAYKVLASPERGWRRRLADVTTATIFAGHSDPVDTSKLADFERMISPYLSTLDTVLKESLIAGHNPYQPLLLHRLDAATGDGLLLVDVEGIFPIAWAAGLEGLIPTLARFGETALLVPQASIEVAPLDRLDGVGVCFITDAPPTRHETWRALRQPPDYRFWTNDRTSPESRLIALASPLAQAAEEAGLLWQALAVQRQSIPLASAGQSLDVSLTLAAAAALGTIAWTLWRERESVTPYLALERFSDLDARVSVDRDSVRVKLSLGRRYQDLYEHGFLLDVPDVPWLDGRILQFSRG